MTLDALVGEVLDKNPELNSYAAEIDAAKGARTTAGLLPNPEVSGSYGQKKVWNEENELTDKGEAREISVMQTFDWPGRIWLRQAIADRDIEIAKLGFERFRLSLASQAKIAAYEFVAAQEIEAATLEVAGHFAALREVLAERNPAGLTPLLEARIIEAMALNMQRKASEASLHARSARHTLNQLRGTAPDDDLLLDRVRLEFRPLEKKPDELVSLARSNDFTVRAKAVELKRQGFAVGLAQNEFWPSISVGPYISEERTLDKEKIIGGAVSLPLPIWNFNQGNIQTAKAQRTQAQIAFDAAERDAERQTIEAAHAYETKLKEMAFWQPDSILHFREAAELADRHFRLGSVPVATYVELQTQYLEAIAGLHGTKAEALGAAMQLELLTGAPLSLVTAAADEAK